MQTESPIVILANLSRGYVTDARCQDAIKREEDLKAALSASYEAMLQLRALLATHAGVSLAGGKLEAVIHATAELLYPPSEEVKRQMANC